jgi:hypothetical protein
MLFDPLANTRINPRGYYIAQWYLSQCYSDYDAAWHSAFCYRWNKAQEKRLLQDWIARRG